MIHECPALLCCDLHVLIPRARRRNSVAVARGSAGSQAEKGSPSPAAGPSVSSPPTSSWHRRVACGEAHRGLEARSDLQPALTSETPVDPAALLGDAGDKSRRRRKKSPLDEALGARVRNRRVVLVAGMHGVSGRAGAEGWAPAPGVDVYGLTRRTAPYLNAGIFAELEPNLHREHRLEEAQFSRWVTSPGLLPRVHRKFCRAFGCDFRLRDL
jgi:hypothetical protein